VSKNCWFEKSVPTSTPRALFDKNSKQTPPAATPKSTTTGQAKVNHASVQSHICLVIYLVRLHQVKHLIQPEGYAD